MATREQKQWQHVKDARVTRQIRKDTQQSSAHTRRRRRDWKNECEADEDRVDDWDLPARERVMPRGERERRRNNLTRALLELESDYELAAAHPGDETRFTGADGGQPSATCANACQGIVVEVGSGICRVAVDSRVLTCGWRSALGGAQRGFTNVLAVGDRVEVSLQSHSLTAEAGLQHSNGIVEAVLPRRSALVRPDVFRPHLQQVIVANVDQVLIVSSWREPALWPELIDRFLVAAERNHLAPVICVNKIDLAGDEAEPRSALFPYRTLGYRVVFTSARTGAGVAELAGLLAGRTTALSGLSGVGKSSLLSAVEPGLQLRTGEVSARRHEGRHTTVQVTLHRLEAGGYVVDTPGVREFGLSGLKARDLAGFYPEIEAVARECRFPDCSHTQESGCAVRQAVRQGQIATVRYENYRKIYAFLQKDREG